MYKSIIPLHPIISIAKSIAKILTLLLATFSKNRKYKDGK